MPDLRHFKTLITDRLDELDTRIHEVEHELDQPKTADLNDQAIDLEDDEVLEGLGIAAQREVMLLKRALGRIADGSYGTCTTCGDAISEARLNAVPYAVLCKTCAT